MAKVIKTSNLSKKDYSVSAGILRVKDSVFNITSDIGDGSRADFNETNPLLYWEAPSNPKNGAVAHVLFNDGLGYYTFNGTVWTLNFFYPSSSYQRPYKIYTALLTQSGTDAPVATVLENTLGGEVVWARGGVGNYTGTLVGAFTLNKTVSNINSNYSAADWEGSLTFRVATLQIGGEDIINLNTAEMIDGAPIALVDDYLNKTQITIKVYP
jgi:hypothetical protein